jgi:hypothetical protein
MRAFFLLVLLANLVFFAWANFFSESDTQSDPRPLARQIAPEKLRVLPSTLAGRSAPPAPAKPAAEPQGTQISAAKTACLELGAFAAADVTRASEALAPLSLGTRLSQRQVDDAASWWVFIPPRGNRQDAQRKAAELKARGVDEYFILQDEGPLRYALSLGVFKTEASATSRLEALRAKGVKTAQVGPRDTTMQKTYFQVRGADEGLGGKLRELAQSFPGSEVRDCAPAPL